MSQTNLHISTPTQFLEVDGARISYRRFGKPSTVPMVFFQHFTGTMDNWDPIITNRLAEGREVILFDPKGVGRSTGAPHTSVQANAQDAIAFIRKIADGPVDLFGFSLGGFTAQEIAVQAPELVRRIILAGTAPFGGEGFTELSPKVMGIIAKDASFEQKCLELFFPETKEGVAAGHAWLDRIARRKDDREGYATAEVAAAQMQAVQGWARGDGDRKAYLGKIAHPVLVVNGDDDIMLPTINSYILQQELPNAQLILYPNSGHAAHFHYPLEFVEAALIFLSAHPA